MTTKSLLVSADRLQRKVQELCRLLQASPHGALISPAAAFLLTEARDEAFTVQNEVSNFHEDKPVVPT